MVEWAAWEQVWRMHFCSSSCLSDRDRCNWDGFTRRHACIYTRCRDAEMHRCKLPTCFLATLTKDPRGHTHWGPSGHAGGQNVPESSSTCQMKVICTKLSIRKSKSEHFNDDKGIRREINLWNMKLFLHRICHGVSAVDHDLMMPEATNLIDRFFWCSLLLVFLRLHLDDFFWS